MRKSLLAAPPGSSKPREKAVLRSVNNALRLFEAFSLETPALGVTELSRSLGLGKSTVHRLLAALAARGYIVKNAQTEKYSLGLKVFEVGSLVVAQRTIRDTAAPFLQNLMSACKETVHLGVLDEWEIVYIEKVDSRQTLQIYSRIGRRAPLHCTALGKVLLAFQPGEDIERFLKRRLKSYTPRTITEPAQLRAELARTRERGYALDNEEFEVGLKCVAAPLRDHTRQVVASLGIASLALRLPGERVGPLTAVVRETAMAISAALGFREVP